MEFIVPLLLFFALVLGLNMLPAFAPPTWSVIVLVSLNSDLHPAAVVLVGAAGAALGRLALAHGFRLLGKRVPAKIRDNLAAARALFEQRRHSGLFALGLFALSPVPSAQLFEAVGLAGIRLLPFTIAFFLGRLVSYSIYTFTAKGIQASPIGDAFAEGFTSPTGLALQVVMIALLVAFARIDWSRWLKD